ncbi:hypothetical protein GQ55_8G086900 [Panicum hallii var. hallii]|uniref:Uncharacterized protein n=1 Tax=Panicum hallii var. hallii TaxID=1504633 RepID=A0A2T7CM42_9POAL|nr:hypothetical protein GQ55_8G086900 [Panicum hallii var. hallii]
MLVKKKRKKTRPSVPPHTAEAPCGRCLLAARPAAEAPCRRRLLAAGAPAAGRLSLARRSSAPPAHATTETRRSPLLLQASTATGLACLWLPACSPTTRAPAAASRFRPTLACYRALQEMG